MVGSHNAIIETGGGISINSIWNAGTGDNCAVSQGFLQQLYGRDNNSLLLNPKSSILTIVGIESCNGDARAWSTLTSKEITE